MRFGHTGQKTAVADMVLTPAAGRGHVCALPLTRAVDSMRSRVFGPIQAVRRSSQTWFCPRPHSFGDGLAGQMGESPMDCSAYSVKNNLNRWPRD